MEGSVFKKKLTDIELTFDEELVRRVYGGAGEAKTMFESEGAKAAGVVIPNEGTHCLPLTIGALLTVYANPHTLSLSHEWFPGSPAARTRLGYRRRRRSRPTSKSRLNQPPAQSANHTL